MRGRKTTDTQNKLIEYTDIPLGAFFVIQAVKFYSDAVLEDEEATKKEMEGTIIDPELWIKMTKLAVTMLLDDGKKEQV